MNSPLMWSFLKSTGYVLRGGYFTFKTEYLKPFPIHRINFKDKAEKETHNAIVGLVDIILDLKNDLTTATSERDRNRTEKKIKDTEASINAHVYKLYDLTAAEIALIESV